MEDISKVSYGYVFYLYVNVRCVCVCFWGVSVLSPIVVRLSTCICMLSRTTVDAHLLFHRMNSMHTKILVCSPPEHVSTTTYCTWRMKVS